MDWSNERYVRLYTRNTDDWIALGWEARAVYALLKREVDRAGVLETKRGARGVAAVCRMPVDVVERGLEELLADGWVKECELGYVYPDYIESEEASQSDAQRQRESRATRRARQLAQPVTLRAVEVTKRDAAV